MKNMKMVTEPGWKIWKWLQNLDQQQVWLTGALFHHWNGNWGQFKKKRLQRNNNAEIMECSQILCSFFVHDYVFLYHCWPGGRGGGGGGGFGDFAFGGGLALLLLECEPRLEIYSMYFCILCSVFFIVRFLSFFFPIHYSSSVIKSLTWSTL